VPIRAQPARAWACPAPRRPACAAATRSRAWARSRRRPGTRPAPPGPCCPPGTAAAPAWGAGAGTGGGSECERPGMAGGWAGGGSEAAAWLQLPGRAPRVRPLIRRPPRAAHLPASISCSSGVKMAQLARSSSRRTKCCWSPLRPAAAAAAVADQPARPQRQPSANASASPFPLPLPTPIPIPIPAPAPTHPHPHPHPQQLPASAAHLMQSRMRRS
jgi:putative serine protease PepD